MSRKKIIIRGTPLDWLILFFKVSIETILPALVFLFIGTLVVSPILALALFFKEMIIIHIYYWAVIIYCVAVVLFIIWLFWSRVRVKEDDF